MITNVCVRIYIYIRRDGVGEGRPRAIIFIREIIIGKAKNIFPRGEYDNNRRNKFLVHIKTELY